MFKKGFFLKAARTLLFAAAMISLSGAAVQAQLPPLIDRELLFGNPEIAGAQLSPDGKYIAFIKPYKDTRNIWVKRADEPFDKARLLTNRTDRPIPSFFWSQDGRFILFTQDKGGDENFNVYAINPAETPANGAEVPAARNLTEAQKVRAFIYAVPETEPDAIYIGLNDRDAAWHDVYKIKISTGEKTLVRKNTDRSQGVFFDNADKMRLAINSLPNGDTEVIRLDGDKSTKIYSCNVFETCSPVRFHKDNKRVYMITNKGDVDLTRLVLFDVETGKEELVESDPDNKVDFGGAVFSDVTDELIYTAYNDERTRRYWKDKKFEADYKFLKSKLGDKEIGLGSSTNDEKLWLVTAYSDTDPGETFLFDRDKKTLVSQYKSRERINREHLAPMKAVSYKSSDGLTIPAFLTLPKGVPAKNLPTVIFPHGGPWARDGWGYNSYAQFLANRGYAVLMPNFRASTGYGKKFLNAGNNEWGQKMQDDLTWGVKYLVEQGIADPKRVGIIGGSYGGYAALAGVTFTPDLYAASVAIVPPSNLMTLLEAIPPYWEAVRTTFYQRMGNPNTPEGKAQLVRQSPLTHAAKIKTPLMVVQGANDPRVNKRESDQIVVALRDRNYPVEYIVAPDEGHGFARPVNNMAMIAAAEKFLAKHLGGRFQETATPEVTARLKEITVDPKTVTIAAKMDWSRTDNAAAGASLAGKWTAVAEAGGQQLEVQMDFKQDGSNLTGSLSSQFGGGTISDGKVSGKQFMANATVDLQGQSVALKIEGTIEGDKITGTMSGVGLPPVTFTATKAK
jgi:dipeptidyl aminopeptidase/acylaminoacyl peptidase